MRLGRIAIIVLVLATVATAGFGSYTTTQTPLIAVLENPQYGNTERLVIRVLFAQADTGWTPLTDQSRFDAASVAGGMQWMITRRGQEIGSVCMADTLPSEQPAVHPRFRWVFPRDMRIEIAEGQDLPLFENTEEKFRGFFSRPKYQPLVLVNSSSTPDPEGWTPIEIAPTSSLRQILYPAFHDVADSVRFGVDHWADEDTYFDYKWTDLRVVEAHRNREGQTIVAVRLNPDASSHSYVFWQYPEWFVHWFLVDDPPVFLGRGLELVDVGDFDGDGRSELVFWYSAYNEDGYVLLYDNLTRRSDYLWFYH